MFGFRKRRRTRLRGQPFPAGWLAILQQNVPYYHRLSPDHQRTLRGDMQVFLAEKHLEGCGGLEITDEIRVTVAAYACILLLGRDHDFYPRLQSILVYPDSYVAPAIRPGPIHNTVMETQEMRLGESWHTGAVVLSWNNIRHRPSDPDAGHNLALHEFAHQLDQEDGAVNGAPLLDRGVRYAAWARILGQEYDALRRDAAAGQPTVLDTYGTLNPAEFFAVATECFFQKPCQMKDRHPELYAALQRFYRQDPAATAEESPTLPFTSG